MSRFRAVFCCVLVLVAAAAAAQSSHPQPADLKIINVMPDCWHFWQGAQAQPQARQVALFRQMVIATHAEAFTPMILHMPSGPEFNHARDRAIADLLPRVPQHAEQDEARARRSSRTLLPTSKLFARNFRRAGTII